MSKCRGIRGVEETLLESSIFSEMTAMELSEIIQERLQPRAAGLLVRRE
jgi:hypothetical protein